MSDKKKTPKTSKAAFGGAAGTILLLLAKQFIPGADEWITQEFVAAFLTVVGALVAHFMRKGMVKEPEE